MGVKINKPCVNRHFLDNNIIHADLAHSVERDLAKVEVAGSSPVIRSKRHTHSKAKL